MRSYSCFFVLLFVLASCSTYKNIPINDANAVIDNWHKAAANADFESYFNLMTDDAVFIGTDATENWQLGDFKAFSKPFFDRGKAWSFSSLERNLYHENGIVYFDELLDTQMGICRGSGVIKIQNNKPLIAHYVLSIAVPNENVESLTELKKEWDKKYIGELQSK